MGVKKKKPGGYLLSRLIGSIIGAGELDFRVRDGNGYYLSAMATGQVKQFHKSPFFYFKGDPYFL